MHRQPQQSRGEQIEPTVELITPAMAAQWISPAINSHNRLLNSRRVAEYARDMQQGNWRLNNDAICFDVNGILLNGQHRLHACILADQPFPSMILRGLPSENQEVMDQHSIRGLNGILQMRDHVNTSRLGAALRCLVDIAHAGDGYKAYRPTPQELLDLLAHHPRLVDSVSIAHACRGVPAGLLAAIHYVGAVLLKDPEKADAFLAVFNSGVPAYSGDPAHVLRENTLRHNERKTAKKSSVQFYAMLHAWNAFRANETRSKWVPPRGTPTVDGLRPDMI